MLKLSMIFVGKLDSNMQSHGVNAVYSVSYLVSWNLQIYMEKDRHTQVIVLVIPLS